MIFEFDTTWRAINLVGQVTGKQEISSVLFVLDTAATETAIDLNLIELIGAEVIPNSTEMIETAAGDLPSSLYSVEKIEILGSKFENVRVRGLDLYKRVRLGGILGWDFLADKKMTIDFPNGTIRMLKPTKPRKRQK